MEDQIPQSFKVQWINTTLKYLKNDNQLIMEYPEMPVHHMEYLHKLIWQRKNDVGLGFKSMYAPVWEAMRIFSLKYQFKVFVNKSVDGQKGHLVIEKIPKNDTKGQVRHDNQEPAKADNSELAEQGEDSQSSDSEDSSQTQPESPMTNPLMADLKKPAKTKLKKKKKKSEKFVIDKQKIIESISPVLLRKALQKILDFLLKQEEASIIFSDLAPVEARFLENFLGIYNKRQFFQGILSPACNALLDQMCEFFKEFDKQCKLEVYAAKYNVNTKKREVTFMKAPRYTRSNATLSQSNFIAPQVKAENIQNVSPFRNSKEKCPQPVISQTTNSNLKITLTNENTMKNDAIEKRKVKLSMNAENREDKLSMNAENIDNKSSVDYSIVNTTITNYSNHRKNEKVKSNKNITNYDATDKIYDKDVKLSMNAGTKDNKSSIDNSIVNTTNTNYSNRKKNEEVKSNKNITNYDATAKIYDKDVKLSMNAGTKDNKSSIDNSIVNTTNTNYSNRKKNEEVKSNKNITNYDATDKIYNKDVKLSMNAGTKDTRLTEKVKIKDTRGEQKKSENKEHLKQEIETIDLTIDEIETPERILPERKIERPTTSNYKLRDGYLGPRKEKLMTAMMTPLESDKAMRMMRLMGWQGGALGLHGHGIVEPIIPALDIVPGKGLGHVAEKPKPTKPVKPVKEVSRPNKAVKISKTTRVEHRTKLLKAILDLISKGTFEYIVSYPTQLITREKICYEVIIQSLNDRICFNLTESEGPILMNIQKIMEEKPELSLKMIFAADFRELTIAKLDKKQKLLTIVADPKKNGHRDFPKIDTQMSKMDFRLRICSAILEFLKSDDTEKLIDFDAVLTVNYFKIAETMCSNINKRTKVPHSYVEELFAKILDNTKECYLEVKMKDETPTRSLLLRKLYQSKPNVNKEVLKNVIKRYVNTTIPDTDKKIDNVNVHKDEENNSYSKETNKRNTDSVSNSVFDNEIKENAQKTNEFNDLNYSIKQNDQIIVNNSNEVRVKNLKENLVRFPLYAKNMNTVDNNDFRKIDMDLLQATIKSLTSHDKKSEENKVKAHNSDININDNSKYIESSKQNDKPDRPCQITKNIRKWYAHSVNFLICDDLFQNISVKDVDPNNNRNHVTLVKLSEDIGNEMIIPEMAENRNCKTDDDTESDKPNQNDESHSKLVQNDQDLKLISEYEGCDGLKDSIDEVQSNELHHSVEKLLECNIIQIEPNSRDDLKLINEVDVCSDNQNSLHVTETEKSYYEVKKHGIEIVSDNVTTQCNDVKDMIDLGTSNQTEKHSESNIKGIPVGEAKGEDSNAVSVNRVKTNSIEECNMIELKKTHQMNEKHSELDLIPVKTNNEEILNDGTDDSHRVNLEQSYESFDAKHIMFDIDKFNNDNREDLKQRGNSKTDSLDEYNKPDKNNSKLDTLQVGPEEKSSPRREPESEKSEESQLRKVNSELDIIQVGTEYIENFTLINRAKTENLGECHRKEVNFEVNVIKEGIELKEKLTRLITEPQKENPENSHKNEDMYSKLDWSRLETYLDYKEMLTLKSELEKVKESYRNENVNAYHSELGIVKASTNYKENLTLSSELDVGKSDKIDPKMDETEVKINHFNTDYMNDSRHLNENRTKELNNARKIDKHCHDIVLIESNILEIETIQKKIKNIIENMGSENVQVFRPLLKYHGIIEKGIVYSCHNKDTCLWLKNCLPDHHVIDYRSAVDNHRLKIKVTSSSKDAKKLLELLEVCNHDLKCHNWKIIYENHYCSSLIIGVEIDSSSFEYICDNNFSLSVGYDFAQFSIAH